MFLAQSGKNMREKMQCTARADAVHCGSGCSALRLRWPQKVPKSKSIFWISPQKQYWTCARTLYICTTIGGEFTPETLLRTSSVPYTEKVRRGEGETTDLGRKCQRRTAATSSSGPSNCCSPVCIFLSITLP